LHLPQLPPWNDRLVGGRCRNRSTETINDAGRKAQASQRDIPAAMKLLLILAATALVAQAADQATIDAFCKHGAFVQSNRFPPGTSGCKYELFKSESCQEDKIENACAAQDDPELCRDQTSTSDCCTYLTLCQCQSLDCASFTEATCDTCSTLPGSERSMCFERCKKCPACVVADAFCVP
jgi:hypothetical protein